MSLIRPPSAPPDPGTGRAWRWCGHCPPSEFATISVDAELDVADPDITSAAVGVIVAIFDEDVDTRAELNGLWTWQATAVGGAYVDLRRAVMDLGSTAPVDGFFEINGNADKSVMVQFLADADGTLRAWANASARDREYVIDTSANVVEE